MCEPVTLAALATAAVGSGIQYKAQRDASKRQDAAIREAEAEQLALSQRKQESVMDAAQNFVAQPNTVQAATAPAQARLEGVAQEASNSWGNRPSQGMVSQDFDVDSARRAADEMKRVIEFAQVQAKGNAGGRAMQAGALGLASDGAKTDDIGSLMRQASARGQANIQRAGRVNQGQMALGSLIQGSAGAVGGAVGGQGMSDYTSAARGWDIAPQTGRASIFGVR
jgi:hypothetical protein